MTLPCRRLFQNFMKIIQHPLFVCGPEGRDQVFFRAVAGDPVDHGGFRQHGHALLQNFSAYSVSRSVPRST